MSARVNANDNSNLRPVLMFLAMFAALAAVGLIQSWSLALAILNLCLISAVMSLGVNIQWGYAGLFNVGIMGFAALGGVAGILMSVPPVTAAWQAGGGGIAISLVTAVATILAALFAAKRIASRGLRHLVLMVIIVAGYFLTRAFFDPAVEAIEAVEPAKTGFLGGLGLPILFSWIVGGIFAAAAAWIVGKIALGLRSDYLAIATLGISEIIVAVLKNEDWLTRGVKNVSGLPRPVPYEVDLQQALWFQEWAERFGATPIEFSSIFVKLCYGALFAAVLLMVLWLSQRALNSPWGRMMRAIRDNEVSAAAMGKNIKGRHLQVFILGSAVVGIAGAMLTTLDGQFTPASYQPLRFTFIIWVMVIVGGSGNNWGSVLGGFVIWFFWIEAEPMGLWLMDLLTAGLDEGSGLRKHLLDSAAHMRLMTMGLILLLVLRFSPRGLIPEK
jgi:branched-chain amino acid transport system permease protein|tara:strand:+ start:3192 stop:4520 length:1329 start_codon:yes stop_codon:yes gene_type:complete